MRPIGPVAMKGRGWRLKVDPVEPFAPKKMQKCRLSPFPFSDPSRQVQPHDRAADRAAAPALHGACWGAATPCGAAARARAAPADRDPHVRAGE
jgi:hypothetical protein